MFDIGTHMSVSPAGFKGLGFLGGMFDIGTRTRQCTFSKEIENAALFLWGGPGLLTSLSPRALAGTSPHRVYRARAQKSHQSTSARMGTDCRVQNR
jgi:hypothetical protein